MAEATIGHLIEEVRAEGRERKKDTKENTAQIVALNKTFTDYFTMLKRQAGDQEEARRDAKAAAGKGAGATAAVSPADKEGGFGFLGIIAGILAAGGALLVGVVEGFTDAARLILRQFRKRLIPKFVRNINVRVGKTFAGIFDSITDFIRIFRGNFLIGFRRLGDVSKNFGKFQILRVKDFSTFAGRLGAFTASINRIFIAIGGIFGKILMIGKLFGLAAREIAKSIPLAPEVKRFIDGIKTLGNSVKGLLGFGKIADQAADTAKSVGGFFSRIGGLFRGLATALKPFLTIFRTLGRVIFFPLTIVMTIFDAIKGFSEGYKEDGILGGILGAIGGIFAGLIGMPLDLLKSAIGWIAGKLGFENFEEQLKSFSFAEMIKDLFMGITKLIKKIFEFITKPISGIMESLGLTSAPEPQEAPAAAKNVFAGMTQEQIDKLTPTQKRVLMTQQRVNRLDAKVQAGTASQKDINRLEDLRKELEKRQNAARAERDAAAGVSVDASQQNNVNVTQTHDVAASDDTDKRPS